MVLDEISTTPRGTLSSLPFQICESPVCGQSPPSTSCTAAWVVEIASSHIRQITELEVLNQETLSSRRNLFDAVCLLQDHLSSGVADCPASAATHSTLAQTAKLALEFLNPNRFSIKEIFERKTEELRAKIGEILSKLRNLSLSFSPNENKPFDDLIREGESLDLSMPTDWSVYPQSLNDNQSKTTTFFAHFLQVKKQCAALLKNDLLISDCVAQEIVRAAETSWTCLVKMKSNGLTQQIHKITHLKIFPVPHSTMLFADFGLGVVGVGESKVVIEFKRIGDRRFVRLTDTSKDPQRPVTAEGRLDLEDRFVHVMKVELSARSALYGVPNITRISRLQYYNRDGNPRTRFIMNKYDKSLYSIVVSEKDDYMHESLQCCRSLFVCLGMIHERGIVHGDVKSANVLYGDDQGYLSDFALFSREGTQLRYCGNPYYMAPETFLSPAPVTDRSSDMFAFGMLMLHAFGRPFYLFWAHEIALLQEEIAQRKRALNAQIAGLNQETGLPSFEGKDPATILSPTEEKGQAIISYQLGISTYLQFQYKALHQKLIQALLNTNNRLFKLIADLISFESKERPSCPDAQKRFESMLVFKP